MPINFDNVVVGVAFTAVGIVIGIISLVVTAVLVPHLMNMLTPNIDEEKEILKGNVAVARYFGGIMQAVIIGMAIIIAASILAGIIG